MITSAGNIIIINTAGTLVTTFTNALPTGVKYFIEVMCPTNAGPAACSVAYFNYGSASVIEMKTDASTNGSGNNGRCNFGKVLNNNGKSVDYYFDDIIIFDTAMPSAGFVHAMLPDGDGNYTIWAVGAGAGADYLQVDEGGVDDGDTTYLLSTGATGNASTVTYQSTVAAGDSATVVVAKLVNAIKWQQQWSD